MRRCCDHERTEQCEDACYDQCQSAAPWRASNSGTVHCNLQHASAPSRATVMARNSTKVRPVAHATKSTDTSSLRADDKSGSGYCDEHAAPADLSDRKHEDFGRSSGAPAGPIWGAQFGLDHLT